MSGQVSSSQTSFKTVKVMERQVRELFRLILFQDVGTFSELVARKVDFGIPKPKRKTKQSEYLVRKENKKSQKEDEKEAKEDEVEEVEEVEEVSSKEGSDEKVDRKKVGKREKVHEKKEKLGVRSEVSKTGQTVEVEKDLKRIGKKLRKKDRGEMKATEPVVELEVVSIDFDSYRKKAQEGRLMSKEDRAVGSYERL